MIAFITLCYCAIIWVIFIKLKLLPWNRTSQVAVAGIGITAILALVVSMNLFQPSSQDVRVYQHVIQIVPRVTGRVIDVAVIANAPVNKGDVLVAGRAHNGSNWDLFVEKRASSDGALLWTFTRDGGYAEELHGMTTDASGRLANSVLRQNIAQYELDTLSFGATMGRVGDEAKAGKGLGAASSIFKYYGTELNKRRNELNLAVAGETALGWEGDAYDGGTLSRDWLRSKGNSIEGGTSEVQLNIISKRVLGLPDK